MRNACSPVHADQAVCKRCSALEAQSSKRRHGMVWCSLFAYVQGTRTGPCDKSKPVRRSPGTGAGAGVLAPLGREPPRAQNTSYGLTDRQVPWRRRLEQLLPTDGVKHARAGRQACGAAFSAVFPGAESGYIKLILRSSNCCPSPPTGDERTAQNAKQANRRSLHTTKTAYSPANSSHVHVCGDCSLPRAIRASSRVLRKTGRP